jgi:hypothetical protein
MFLLKTLIQKVIPLTAAVLTICILVIAPANGQGGSNALLEAIAVNTYNTSAYTYRIQLYAYDMLEKLDDLITSPITSILAPDTSTDTAIFQGNFTTQANSVLNNNVVQGNLQQDLMRDLFVPVTSNPPDFASQVDFANDMSYGGLIGKPYYEETRKIKGAPVNYAYNYLKNVAGVNITHVPPSTAWTGFVENQLKYKNFYTTVSAIQSYSAYVLSQLYADQMSGNSLTQQQMGLTLAASNPTWFKKVATESMGTVFRQILLFNSQLYVLMTQLLQAQKQMLAELAMTNTLIVIGDSFTEGQLLVKARS